MRSYWVVACLVLGAVAAARPSLAVEWLQETELQAHCQQFLEAPQSREGALCIAFIQGFLAGAEATDGIVAERVQKMQAPTGDALSDRMIKTRIGSRLKQYGTPYYAGYCIAEDVSSQTVIAKVIDYLNEHPDEPSITANQAVYMGLVYHFPCED
ncbi:MAG: hypothetical protein Tsb0016_04410 [Sphingomonadales bacterium]